MCVCVCVVVVIVLSVIVFERAALEATKHTNKSVLCNRLYDMFAHVVVNRHLEAQKRLECVGW